MADFTQAWKTGKPQRAAGPVSIREAARRVGRDVKAVHGDVAALLNAGVFERVEDGRIVFPFEAVKVEFLLQPEHPPGRPPPHALTPRTRARRSSGRPSP